MSAPINGNSTQIVTSAVKNTLTNTSRINAPVAVAAGAALLVSYMMMRDSYKGSRDRLDQKISEVKEENDVEYSKFGWGHWSGKPYLDYLAHKWFGLKEFGPYGIKENAQEIGMRVSNMWSNVVVPNLIPLGIGIAGMYGALGPRRMHAPIRGFVNWCKKTSIPPSMKREFKTFFGNAFKGIGKGLGTVAKWPFLRLSNLGIALGGLFLGTWALKQFNDSYGHDGQRAWFRPEVYDKHGVD